jgi:hypothetical protein
MATFKEAFAAARKEKGAGKTFMYNGKSYSTNYDKEQVDKSDKPKAKPAAAGKVAAKESVSGASRSTAGKVKPKVDMPARPTGGAKAKQIAIESATASNVASNKAAAKRKANASEYQPTSAKLPEWLYFVKKGDLQKMKDILVGGGLSNYMKKK